MRCSNVVRCSSLLCSNIFVCLPNLSHCLTKRVVGSASLSSKMLKDILTLVIGKILVFLKFKKRRRRAGKIFLKILNIIILVQIHFKHILISSFFKVQQKNFFFNFGFITFSLKASPFYIKNKGGEDSEWVNFKSPPPPLQQTHTHTLVRNHCSAK